MTKVGFLVAGVKGFNFLKEIHQDCNVILVSSYVVKGTLDDSFKYIKSLCLENGYKFIDRHNLNNDSCNNADVIFVAGWQYIINKVDDRFVVFHDSLLPRFRGFCPTVTALILGERNIGVSALKPSEHIDGGPIYDQKCSVIEYPIKIKDAYLLLSDCYAQIAKCVLKKVEDHSLTSVPQDESLATYSIWRDELDYFINWNWPSDKIARFVDAVGWPYYGAKTLYQEEEIFIDEVVVTDNLIFEDRQPGKIWSLDNGIPTVVCGKGTIRIISARGGDGTNVKFTRLRKRFGSLKAMC